jgi:hypothetical protein
MRPTRVRFTVRWIMAAVAIVAVLFFMGVQLDRFRKLRISYTRRAAELKLEEAYTWRNIQRTTVVIDDIQARLEHADGKGEPRLRSLEVEQRVQIARYAEYARYLGELRSKYEKAAVSPWFPVAPDPVPPRP